MSYQLWFQFNSKDRSLYQESNKPMIQFLRNVLPKLIPKIRSLITFQVVDTAKTDDVAKAEAMGITSLPLLRLGSKNKAVGLKAIQAFLAKLSNGQKARDARRSREELDENMNPVKLGRDEQEIEDMWRNEIIENSDDEEDANEDVNDRMARATAFTKRREKEAESPYARRKNKDKKGNSKLNKGRNNPKRPPSRSRRTTAQGSTQEDDEEANDISEEEEPKRKPKARGKRKANVEASPAEISRGLDSKNAESSHDDELMAQFWENNTETAY